MAGDDDDAFERLVTEGFAEKVTVLYFNNDEPDIRSVEMEPHLSVAVVARNLFRVEGDVTTMLVENLCQEDYVRNWCPDLHIAMSKGKNPSINFKLLRFCRAVNLDRTVCDRMCHCKEAVVMGFNRRIAVSIPVNLQYCWSGDLLACIEKFEEAVEMRLLLSCYQCSDARIRCSHGMPCESCAMKGLVCSPAQAEDQKRVEQLVQGINAGTLPFSARVIYQLYLESVHYSVQLLRPTRSSNDRKDIYRLCQEQGGGVCRTPMDGIPVVLADVLHGAERFKVEWMDAGQYRVETSKAYAEDIMSAAYVMALAQKTSTPPKLIDTCNLDMVEGVYRLWVNSVRYPFTSHYIYGSAIMRGQLRVCKVKVEMMTVITGVDSMVVGTAVHIV